MHKRRRQVSEVSWEQLELLMSSDEQQLQRNPNLGESRLHAKLPIGVRELRVITRATVASYETGRRPIPAEALLRIARICGQPLAFFEPAPEGEGDIPQGNAGPPASKAQVISTAPRRRAALDALISALELRPDAIPITLEFVETYIQDTAPEKP